MYKYRITKYNPSFRDEEGVYTKDEWTSYYDIGKTFDGNVFLLESYKKVEQQYCSVIKEILQINNVKEVRIHNLELFKDLYKELNKKVCEIDVFANEKDLLTNLRENAIVIFDDVDIYVKQILKEFFWCELCDANGIKIVFGYDYYMYVTCPPLEDNMIKKYADDGIFIEKYERLFN